MNTSPRRIILILITILGFGGIIAYGYVKALPFLRGPVVAIESPRDGEQVANNHVTIRGTALQISRLTLNDHHIFTNEEGLFEETLVLPEGYSIITLMGKDRFDRETKKEVQVLYKQ